MTPGENQNSITTAVCPICKGEAITSLMYKMQDSNTKETSIWHHCSCGAVFNYEHNNDMNKFFGQKYINTLLEDKEKYADSMMYPCRIYSPIIEDLTYGRKMLDVGYASPYNMMAFRKRGWIAYGIDKVDIAEQTHRLIKGDFLDIELNPDHKYDLIWMSNVLENMSDPIEALEKAYDLMPENGVLYISTPDTDFINKKSTQGFSHWTNANNIMLSEGLLNNILKELGFRVILSRKNHENRFTAWDNVHVIAQKIYF